DAVPRHAAVYSPEARGPAPARGGLGDVYSLRHQLPPATDDAGRAAHGLPRYGREAVQSGIHRSPTGSFRTDVSRGLHTLAGADPMTEKMIRPIAVLFLLVALYDGLLGAVFLMIPSAVFRHADIPPPNHFA